MRMYSTPVITPNFSKTKLKIMKTMAPPSINNRNSGWLSPSNSKLRDFQVKSWENHRKKQQEAITAYIQRISKENREFVLARCNLPRTPGPPSLKGERDLQECNEFKKSKQKHGKGGMDSANIETHKDTSVPCSVPSDNMHNIAPNAKKAGTLYSNQGPEDRGRRRRTRRISRGTSFRGLIDEIPRNSCLSASRKRPRHPAVESKERAEKRKRDRKYENVTVVSGRLFDVQYRVPRKLTRPGNPRLDSKERSDLKKRNRRVEGVLIVSGRLVDVSYRGSSPFRSNHQVRA